MNYDTIIDELRKLADPEKVIFKQQKFNIVTPNSLGIYHKDLKILAKEIGFNASLGHQLASSDIYEARLLGSKLLRPKDITPKHAQEWIKMFDTWEICDSFCMGLFSKTTFAKDLIFEWTSNSKEFEKRAPFATLASYCMADKKAENKVYENFIPLIVSASNDNRIYVKKAVNWALRNIGKRNIDLNKKAIITALAIKETGNKSAIWIDNDALRELQGVDVKILDYPRSIYRNNT